jgi:hypothetical protein
MVGLLAFNTILSRTTEDEAAHYFLIVILVQVAAPVIYKIYKSRGITGYGIVALIAMVIAVVFFRFEQAARDRALAAAKQVQPQAMEVIE